MKYVRVAFGRERWYGVLKDEVIHQVMGSPFESVAFTGNTVELREVTLLAPCESSKIICIGLNYRDHAEELGLALPSSPVVFLKPPTSLIGAGEAIIKPELCTRLDYEAELAIVIGKRVKDIDEGEAEGAIFGYTCANDVTARNLQDPSGQWIVAKGFDTFCPVGPWIETEADPARLKIESRVNGQVRQSSVTDQLIFPIPYLVSYLSQIMTLNAGDLILTGTPGGIGPMEVGDTVQIIIEGIGTLENPVK
jgi:2-keto-4-pentenoate hydratase/2-oxohepta-3-ene-1,7-dioic acid hydratase in catechol pathway